MKFKPGDKVKIIYNKKLLEDYDLYWLHHVNKACKENNDKIFTVSYVFGLGKRYRWVSLEELSSSNIPDFELKLAGNKYKKLKEIL